MTNQKAFPSKEIDFTESQMQQRTVYCGKDFGMDLRDYFAARSMQALISNFANDAQGWEMSHLEIAIESYRQADAMMEARK